MENTDMPIELRNWLKEQIRSIERGELEDWKKYKILDLMEQSIKEHKAEIYYILLKEVLEEEKMKKQRLELFMWREIVN